MGRDSALEWARVLREDPDGYRQLYDQAGQSLALASWRLAVVRLYVGPEFITPIPTRIDIGAAAATLCTRLQLRIPCPSVVLEELEAIGLTVM